MQDKEKDDSLGVKEQEKEEKQQTFQANEPKKVWTPAQRKISSGLRDVISAFGNLE